jgi:hypothetical protein
MLQTSQSVDKPVSRVLAEIIQRMPAEGLTLQALLEWLGERGLLIFCMVLTIPFLLPVSIPGTSAPFGLLIALNAVGLAMHKSPWLPARLMNRRLAVHHLAPMLEKGAHLFARLEKFIRPRLLVLTHRASTARLNIILLGFAGLLLTAPLPLPFSNTLPAYGVLFLAMGNLERDGYAVMAGYVMVFLSVVYFGTIAILGGLGANALASFL